MNTRHRLLVGCGVFAMAVIAPIHAQSTQSEQRPGAQASPSQAPPQSEAKTKDKAGAQASPSQAPPQSEAKTKDKAASEEKVEERVIEEIVVMGKSWKELLDQPLPVTAFSAEDRNLMSVNTARDLVNLTPGVTFTETHGLNVRGVGRQTAQTLLGQENAVVEYVDGFINLVPSNIAESTLFGGNVQFTRGPQGTRFGRNSIGGAVNLVSRAPTKEFRGEAVTGIGRGGAYNVGANISGPITDNLGFRIGAQRFDVPSTATNIGTAKHVGFALKNNYFEGQLDWSPGRFHMRTRTTHFEYDNQPGYTSPAAYNTTATFGGLAPNPQYKYDVASPQKPYALNVDYVGYDKLRNNFQQIVNADLDLGSTSLFYTGGYQQYRATGSSDLDLTSRRNYTTVPADPFIPGTIVPTFYTANYDNNNRLWSHELRLESKQSGTFRWVLGGYYYRQPFDETYWEAIPDAALLETPSIGTGGGGTTALNPKRATYQQRNLYDIRSTAPFANFTWSFTPEVELDAGLRYTWDQKQAHTNFRYVFSYPPVFAGDVTPAAHSADPSQHDQALTGHAALTWRPTPGTEIYASFARGYQSSAFTLGQGLPPNNIAAPEHLNVYEMGATRRASTFELGGSLFYQDFSNMQIPISSRAINAAGLPLGPVYQRFVNAQLAKIYGLEAESSWTPSPGTNLTVSYTLLNPTFSSFCPTVPGSNPPVCGAVDITEAAAQQVPENLSGNEVPRAPRNKVSLYGYYTIRMRNAGSIIPGGSVSYQDKYYASAFQKDRFIVPSRKVVNFTLTYRTKESNFDLVASVTNAFREIYAENLSVAVVGSTIASTRILGADRYYSLTSRFRF